MSIVTCPELPSHSCVYLAESILYKKCQTKILDLQLFLFHSSRNPWVFGLL